MDELIMVTSDGRPNDSVDMDLLEAARNTNNPTVNKMSDMNVPMIQHEHSRHERHSNFLHFLHFVGSDCFCCWLLILLSSSDNGGGSFILFTEYGFKSCSVAVTFNRLVAGSSAILMKVW